MTREQSSYRIADDDESTAREYRRLRMLSDTRDPRTIAVLERIGVAEGWHCLEVGAGAGTVSAWMAERVGPTGSVLSVDIDLRFHGEPTGNMEVRELDVVHDPLPEATFDVVHARAVLQHIPEREQVVDRLVSTLKPGGWLVVEDGDFRAFEAQPLPEPLAGFHGMMTAGAHRNSGHEPNFGSRLLSVLQAAGLTDIDLQGDAWPMVAGEPSSEWWVLAMEYASTMIVEAGLLTREAADEAIAQARRPGFVMLSPLSVAVWGRRPG